MEKEIEFPEGYCPIAGFVAYLYSVCDHTYLSHDPLDTVMWVQKIHKQFDMEPSLSFVAQYYSQCYMTHMRRVVNKDFAINFDMLEELIILALMMASKAYQDVPRSNFAWMRTFPEFFNQEAEFYDNENVHPQSRRTVREMYRLENLNSAEYNMFHLVLDHRVMISHESIRAMLEKIDS